MEVKIMASNFSLFKAKNAAFSSAEREDNAKFIFGSYPSVQLQMNDKVIPAVIVNKQENDEAYFYTTIKDNLVAGETVSHKGLHWIIDEEIVIIKPVAWRKYHAFLCNVQLDDTHWGYFIGPEKSKINVSLKENVYLYSDQKPVLVAAPNLLQPQDRLWIRGRAWEVQEYDNISKPDITYYTLTTSTISEEEHAEQPNAVIFPNTDLHQSVIIPQEPTSFDNTGVLGCAPLTKIVVATEEGYFESSEPNIIIIGATDTKVVFQIPFGIKHVITIKHKQKGAVVISRYQVI